VFNQIKKYQSLYDSPRGLLELSESKRHMVLKALTCYSKFRGEHELFKTRYKAFGIKCGSSDGAFNAFLHIFNHKHEDLPRYLKEIKPYLTQPEQTYVEFVAMTGMRPSEAVTAFNLIISLHGDGRLGEYYNPALQCLEHYKHRDLFLRGTKNCFISFVPQSLVTRICQSLPINHNKMRCCLKRRGLPLQLKQLRSYHNSTLRKAGVMAELVDILAGRVPKSVFVRHYLAADLQQLSGQVLMIQQQLMAELFTAAG
jgi:hypothetical protein